MSMTTIFNSTIYYLIISGDKIDERYLIYYLIISGDKIDERYLILQMDVIFECTVFTFVCQRCVVSANTTLGSP
jgi:hypothetical protein